MPDPVAEAQAKLDASEEDFANETAALNRRLTDTDWTNNRVIDPSIAESFSAAEGPPPGEPTVGPQSLNIFVPCDPDKTNVNLGKDVARRVKLDRGIHLTTARHLDFEVRNKIPTVMSMGTPMLKHGYTARDTQPTAALGYTLLTDGDAVWASDLKHVMSAEKAGAHMFAGTLGGDATLESKSGNTEVVAKLKAIAHGSNKVRISTDDDGPGVAAKFAVTVLAQIPRMVSVVGGLNNVVKTFIPGTHAEKANGVATIGKTIAWFAKISGFATSLVGTPQSVSVSSSNGIGMYGTFVSLYGLCGAGTGGGASASLIGGTADVKGWACSSIHGGLSAVVSSIGDVDMKAYGGFTAVSAPDVIISSAGTVVLKGGGKASLRGGGKAAVYGKTSAYLGTGSGFGMVVGPEDVSVGPIANPTKLATAKAKKDPLVKVDKNSVRFSTSNAGSKLAVNRENASVRGTRKSFLRASSSGLRLKGKRITTK